MKTKNTFAVVISLNKYRENHFLISSIWQLDLEIEVKLTIIEKMKKNLSLCLILLFFAGTAKAGNLAPESIKGARTINTATAKLLFDRKYPFIDVNVKETTKQAQVTLAS